MLSQSVLWERRSILSCENAANMLVSKTESKMLCLWCCRNLRFCSVYCVNMPWYNIQYSTTWVTSGSFLFLCKTLVFLFLPFLNLDPQTRCLVNRYIDLKSALDQPLVPVHVVSFFECVCVCVMSNQSTSIKPLHLTSVNQCLVA